MKKPLVIKITRFLLIVTLSLVFLCGCGSRKVAPTINNFSCDHPAVSVIEKNRSSQKDPVVSKITIKNQNIFVTSMTECKIRDYVPTRATSRQLLSGFEELAIKNEGYINTNNSDKPKIFKVLATAKIDTTPINIFAASTRKNDCVTDTVFWQESSPTKENTYEDLSTTILPILDCIN